MSLASPTPEDPPRLRPDAKIADLGQPQHVWAIGALHGRYGPLCALHEALSARLKPGVKIVYLGNYLGAHSQWTGEGQALINELITFRNAFTSIPDFSAADIVHLRGRYEDLALQLLRLPFQKNPSRWAAEALEKGLEGYLSAYGVAVPDLLSLAGDGVLAAHRFAHHWQKLISSRTGHNAFYAQLSNAAQTSSPKPLLFIPEGLDPQLPLGAQQDYLRWPEADIADLPRYRNYNRLIRGAGANLKSSKAFVLTLDGGNALDGMIHAACLDPQGQVIEHLTF